MHEASLLDALLAHVARGGLMIGICNGFQLMVKLGLLPGLGGARGVQQATLTWNDSGRYEDRWVTLGFEHWQEVVTALMWASSS